MDTQQLWVSDRHTVSKGFMYERNVITYTLIESNGGDR